MPRKTSRPLSGNVVRSLPGVTVCMDMDNRQNLQLRILSITADPFAHHILSRNQVPASSGLTAVRRVSEISDTPPPSLTTDALSMTHRLAVEEALRKGCTPVANIRPGICHFCQTRKTTQWRKGPAGIRTLCNVTMINYSSVGMWSRMG
jgi:hypothetical protein